MKATLIKAVIQRISEFAKIPVNPFDLGNIDIPEQEFRDANSIKSLINLFNEAGSKVRLAFLQNEAQFANLVKIARQMDLPIVLFRQVEDDFQPIILYSKNNQDLGCQVLELNNFSFTEQDYQKLDNLISNDKGEVVFLSVFTYESLVSNDHPEDHAHLTPMKRFFRLLSIERKDILYIYIYAVIIGIVSLSLPLGIQAIVGLISSGMLFQTVVLLIIFVLIGILITGGLQIMQITIVEILQRRIFTKAAFEFAFRVPRLKLENMLGQHAPELMNRFFDILTIQKGLPKLLIEMSGAALQILFGLLLLAFYHPFFVFFGLVLLTALVMIFNYTGPKGLQSSITESKYKYKVVYWLEEVARTITSFKLAGNTYLPIKKTDEYVNNYLKNRKIHFQVLVTQLSYIILFKTLVTGGLLIIGSLLVIDRQITLGQFVASEIIIILILSSVEKIITYMDVVYDLLTAVDKIGHVTDLPLEKNTGVRLLESQNGKDANGFSVRTKNLRYKYIDNSEYTLKGIDLEIEPGSRIGFAGYSNAGKSTLMNILSGLFTEYEGIATINQISVKDLDLVHIRHSIAKNISQEDIFDGTIMDNIAVGMSNIHYKEAMDALEIVGLKDMIDGLPDGINTSLTSGGKKFASSVINKLILARCIAKNPKLMILNDFFHNFHKTEKQQIISKLVDPEKKWTILAVSNDPIVLSACDKVYLMKEGRIINSGTCEELFNDDHFMEVLYNN